MIKNNKDYITIKVKTLKKYKWWILAFVLVIIVPFLIKNIVIIERDVLFWVFSTVPQVFGALFALSITMILILNQKLSSDFDSIRSVIEPIVAKYHEQNIRPFSNITFYVICESITEEGKTINREDYSTIKNAMITLNSITRRKESNKTYFLSFAITMEATILLSLIFLSLVDYLIIFHLEVQLLFIILYLSVFSIAMLVRGLIEKIDVM